MTDQPVVDERSLALRAQDGDVEAFESLVDRSQGRLFRIAYMVVHDRADAEDVVQESLVLAWRRLHLLDDPAAFGGWVARICSRAATDLVRRQARRATDAAEHQDLDLAAEPGEATLGGSAGSGSRDPARTAEVNAQMEALAGILTTVDPELRACWVLREIDGMAYRDIARALDVSEQTVRGRISRARTQIVDRMEEWR